MAGLVLIAEAGGRINDFLANGGLMNGIPILGATPAIYEALWKVTGGAARQASDDAAADEGDYDLRGDDDREDRQQRQRHLIPV